MAASNMHNLTTLIKRLEAATSRLEDMAAATLEPSSTNGTVPSVSAAVSSTPAAPASAPVPAPAPPAPTPDPLPEAIEAFDTELTKPVEKFVALSREMGGPVAIQATTVQRSFTAQRIFLLISTKAKKPDMSNPVFMDLLKPLQEGIQTVNQIREGSRDHPLFNNLSAVSESIEFLAWVTMDGKPFKHIDGALESAQYWGNRVVKGKDAKQVEWMQSYYQLLKTLSTYVKDTYPQGIPWNPKGIDAKEAIKLVESSSTPSAAAAAPPAPPPPPSGGAPPPPPPPPGPPPKFDVVEKKAQPAPQGGIDAVFSELNKGEAVTKGLRKVDKSEMTHKNPSLRAGATVPTRSDSQNSLSRGKSPAPGKKPKPESMRTKKPPRKELDGNKWIIENFDNEAQPVEVEANMTQSILISRCGKTTIIVRGKANAISVDNSPRLSLIIESLVSSVDVIKSSSFALQVLGTLPTVLMDGVDGAQVYLSKESMNTEVFASKSSGINLNIIEGEEEDYKEVALPEQIRTYIGEDGKVMSEIVEHAG